VSDISLVLHLASPLVCIPQLASPCVRIRYYRGSIFNFSLGLHLALPRSVSSISLGPYLASPGVHNWKPPGVHIRHLSHVCIWHLPRSVSSISLGAHLASSQVHIRYIPGSISSNFLGLHLVSPRVCIWHLSSISMTAVSTAFCWGGGWTAPCHIGAQETGISIQHTGLLDMTSSWSFAAVNLVEGPVTT
jgi:hypothetical protein